MSVRFDSVTFVSGDPEADAAFWGAVLGRTPQADGGGILLPGDHRQVGLRFAGGAAHGTERNRLHLHLSRAERRQAEAIAAAVEHGGRLRGNGHVPTGSYAAMADPVGDEFCVIEDENTYLAGCGPLGEVTCEGTQATGIFWSRALGWPVVWDEGEEVAIQAPAGGTKLAWSGEPVDAGKPTDRQYFLLTAPPDELADEVARLVGIGATDAVSTAPDATALRDPDGIVFLVRADRPSG
ncbi:VOC family protein [Leifsonia sp. fls2-241-R2A-40a]|uniref:VOC family protein n=1 Tax=Leifsonia sp. fls2-241-R2A-40a TaxID=3040290 RepID=UPI00255053E7|nr:VOC family protein [Leifsonia sp. fls2-241-R2A-40a]